MPRRPALILLSLLLLVTVTSFAAGGDAPALASSGGAPFFPCPPLPDSAAAYLGDVSVATDGWGFLVISTRRAQPLDANGRPSGEARALPPMSSVERTEVEWGGDRYVATITSRPKDYLFTITRGGEVIAEPELLPLVETRLAFNGSAGMLVGRATVNGTPAIYAVPVTNEGSVGTPTLLVTNNALGTLDVAPLDDGFVAVIALDTGELVAQRLDAFGTPRGTPQFLAGASTPMPLRAVSGPSGILVSWREAVGDQAYFKTLAIRSDGTVGEVHVVLDRAGWDPHLVATETGYLLVSARRDAGTFEDEPLALPLDAEGRPLGEPRALPGMPDAVAPATGGRVLVLSHLRTYTLESWMSASYLVGHDGIPLSQPEPIVVEKAPQREVRAASDGDAFMVAWITTTAAGERIDTSALTTSSEERTCRTAHSSAGRLQGLALAGSPAGYLLVWGEANSIRASTFQNGSWNEVPTGLALERRRELDADLAWDGDAFLLVWVEDRALRAARIAPTGAVSDLGELVRSDLVLSTPGVAALPSGAVITVRTEAGYPRYDYAPSGAMVFALDRSGSMASHQIEPLRPPTLSEIVPDIDVDIAAGGTGAMLAMRDAHDVWAIALGPDGTPLRRTRIAGGIDVSNVAIAAVPGGFAISWIADDTQPELAYPFRERIFTAFVDHDGALAGPFRSSEGSVRDTDYLRRRLLDVAARGFEILAGWHGRVLPDMTVTRATAALLSSGLVHPGPLPPPDSLSLHVTGPDRFEIRWAPLPGATRVRVEAKKRGSPLWWWGFSFDPMAGSAVIEGSYEAFRIATEREALVSEWIELRRPVRRRVVARAGDAGGFAERADPFDWNGPESSHPSGPGRADVATRNEGLETPPR